ncbi:peptide deformylase [bacterium]|nr:peptide deformylase [bacterium]
MSVLPINIWGDSVLRKKVDKVTEITNEELNLIDDMIETMFRADGAGLAANQIGIPKSIAIINFSYFDENVPPQALFNIELLEKSGSDQREEGCLSIPGINENVVRPDFVKISYQNIIGEKKILECEGLLARVIQHELDHLNGVLFVDRLSSVKRKLINSKLKNIGKNQ